ncbi:murein biosynthesis integral membrane protein MurJ [Gordonia sp. HNM0687]|uniref:Murein biosynthesis integral membrane protein MurJ n=1 Tax=Gordonia mangrovi TaxID=2665643 RepID=A0A6L7GP59_9ACTN|nr:murein biosynthesis integral membrane protein MurJ [Gordonia mangrovi]MXP21402.1 murein biosynthesis integral membrane protein MurJ [Gordonia mangrovi]UVF80150.1 murein biosynthesis integral membrane protein MurJ [Gordonia mangrovi]
MSEQRPPESGRATPRRIPPGAPSAPPPRGTPAGRGRPAAPRSRTDTLTDSRNPRATPTGGTNAGERAGVDIDETSTGLSRDSDASILKTSGSIALATLTSRITGFVRTVLVLAMLGPAIASAFQAAYVLPNMIAEVVLGAVLTAIVIPVLVRAEAEDDDGGRAFINRIFTLTVVTLGAATVISLIAAPLLTYLNVGDGDVNRDLTTALAYLLLPEILFYGLSALFMAILNMKGFFKPGAWAPVLNNIVQIATLVLYAAMPGEITLNPVRMSDPQLLVLGIGTTLGVVVQAMILVPWLKRAGVRLQLQWGLDARLRRFGNMAVAIVMYVAILQVGLVVTYRIAAHADAAGISVYATHWQLLQLPYGVLGVTILTAIMPRMSRNAAADDNRAVVDDLSLATRLTMVALVPVVAYMTFFGPAIGVAVFNFGKFDAETASQLGSVLAWGAFTLIPYAMTLVQLRVFYAREDAWTPTVMVLGITVVKVAASLLGPVLFTDPELVVRWLALSNGLGYLVGAVVGHFLLRKRLDGARLTDVARTTTVTLVVSVGISAIVWAVAQLSGLHLMMTEAGKFGSLIYLVLTAVVVLGVTYAGLAVARLPDVVSIGLTVRRVLGRFIPALAPAESPVRDSTATITVQFPQTATDESLPYSGQVQVLRRFDRGTATWQSYSVHSGGAARLRDGGEMRIHAPRDMRYRRRGARRVTDNEIGATQDTEIIPDSPADTGGSVGVDDRSETSTAETAADRVGDSGHTEKDSDTEKPDQPATPAPATTRMPSAGPPARPRGPRLVPGAAVAGGRYRLLDHHGGTRGLQFWRARDINLDREVALTFVDAEQLAPPPRRGETAKVTDDGPQGVLSRTLRLGQISSAGVARVLDVVRGSSGGIVVSEWVTGSSLAEVARSEPSPIGAARAVRALAAAAEATHRSGGALSIDHPDRIRISTDGNAVLAFPGTLAGDDKSSDVRGLGAVLYALLLARWPLDGRTGTQLVTTSDTTDEVGGLPIARPDKNGTPVEPREARPDTPFEISAVAARALDGNRGIRTAGTVQHVLDQATVIDLNTDMLPAIETDRDPITMAPPPARTAPGTEPEHTGRRNMALLAGAGLLALFVIIALIVWATNIFGSDGDASDIDSILTTTSAPPAPETQNEAAPPPAAPAPIPLQRVNLVDFSNQPPDSSANLGNVISGVAPPWSTDIYRGSPDFGGLKDGLGLMFDLGSDQSVATVTIRTPTPGFDVSIRTATSAQPTFAETTEVATGTVSQPSTTITIPNPTEAPFVMVWLTSLPAGGGGFQAEIARVSMAG